MAIGAGRPTEREGPEPDRLPMVCLRARIAQTVDLERVPHAFGDDAGNWLGEPAGRNEAGLARYLCDLELRVSPERLGAFRKAAIVSIGVPARIEDGWAIALEWQAASLAPLFPVLVGTLVVQPGRLTIDGRYAPPFGVVGLVLDKGLLSIAAHRTARWFLTKVAGVLAASRPE
jgi:hypothetical protein